MPTPVCTIHGAVAAIAGAVAIISRALYSTDLKNEPTMAEPKAAVATPVPMAVVASVSNCFC